MRLIKYILPVAISGAMFASCSNVTPLDLDDMAQDSLLTLRDKLKWAEEDAAHKKNLEDSVAIAQKNAENREKYIQDLRAYKLTEHPLMFGWFASWNPDSPDKEFSLSLLPDSVDWVSCWGAAFNLNDKKKQDLEGAHERGIRMTIGWIIENVGQGITEPKGGWMQYQDADGNVDPYKAIDQYVMMLCDSIQKYNYDGMDVDYEPSFASPFKQGNHCGDWNAKDLVDHIALISCSSTSNKERENYFFTRMREELDKREAVMGKELMFNINGSLSYIDEKVAPLFDFFVAQSYHSAHSSWSTSLNRFAHLGITPQKQLLLTETFENNEANAKGFDEYADFILNGGGTPKAAGIGAYHINADKRFGANEEAGEYYLNVRRVIQKLNPSMVPED